MNITGIVLQTTIAEFLLYFQVFDMTGDGVVKNVDVIYVGSSLRNTGRLRI